MDNIFRKIGFTPKRKWGQHFIVDKGLALRVAEILPPNVDVVEVGGGLGALTSVIIEKTRQLTVVEIDEKLADYLENKFDEIRLIRGDFLRVELPRSDYIVSALPYSISKPFILKLVRDGSKWRHAVLILQKEFAEKLTAKPCEENYREISVLAQYACDIRLLERVSRKCFYPEPRVDSILSVLSVKDSYDEHTARLLEDLTSRLFNYKNRTLRTALNLAKLSTLLQNLTTNPDLLKMRVGCLDVAGFIELAKKL
ncbi:ribosomal RNA small subunit methyltransferase A [Candidatus Marsarchaeota G2 archaeon OSP_D]|jgi:Dimethyladenosine transferase (rRNA methylation)|uniref:Ribosomal RNA small subunit methyltransferase A n=7 Tax=Candidatus Marsarchaeota group 2 TaxID=2203771 RepID=A0A2R6CAZ6_9ARCH|nr:MAG: ribosomal RNA small subunit methyltransferase A [Candidatus Marsarchaeota G2 archaeon ECH_B_SAG-M15]PSN90293.1 MAG: ribosomal RNA small subunit methyltransferase A [Candidatus Marsarchaeota G2 archaeon OSP_D]PSN96873.1 MAG: ribosomal RNA small subunit methyltransferase A [Candidatus Marsarchaeota G2 archaeon ECH_B_2]PSN97100.1 MAG: ribosomal RNA small subunit methyltransferase A [Candidatus Marsarchaeota G2 archaeon ECH_B_SAG-C16]PSN97426.1 MAG: ribosomal RNA small subunit methyltransfe